MTRKSVFFCLRAILNLVQTDPIFFKPGQLEFSQWILNQLISSKCTNLAIKSILFFQYIKYAVKDEVGKLCEKVDFRDFKQITYINN